MSKSTAMKTREAKSKEKEGTREAVEDMSEVLKRMKQEGGDEFTGQEDESPSE